MDSSSEEELRAGRLRDDFQGQVTQMELYISQSESQIWAIFENGLRGFWACCENFPQLRRRNVTVSASVCRGLSGHSSLYNWYHHPPHLKAEPEDNNTSSSGSAWNWTRKTKHDRTSLQAEADSKSPKDSQWAHILLSIFRNYLFIVCF